MILYRTQFIILGYYFFKKKCNIYTYSKDERMKFVKKGKGFTNFILIIGGFPKFQDFIISSFWQTKEGNYMRYAPTHNGKGKRRV